MLFCSMVSLLSADISPNLAISSFEANTHGSFDAISEVSYL